MANINSKEDWWKTVYDNLENFNKIAYKCGIDNQNIQKFYEEKDWYTLLRIFNKIWFAAPDDSSIRSWEGWFDLCDCCSEGDTVFNERDEE